jgi:CubicO group peptidase (beta-lactamase class C family)
MKTKFIISYIAMVMGCSAFSQEMDTVKLNGYFDSLAVHNKFMGSVAVSQNGNIVYTKAIGFADIATGKKADVDTKYRIGSISKTFTTVLVFKAIEANKLTLDETIQQYFPTINNADKITISELLYHRSGIHNFTNDSSYMQWNTQPKTEKELVDIIARGGSDFEPGSKLEYSNSNFVLLTIILEKVFQQSYAALLDKYIIQPTGLKHTFFGRKINTRNDEANSYTFSDGWQLSSETDMSIPLGAGGIVSTPSDLVQFSNALFSRKLVSETSLQQMETLMDNYGAGLFPIPFYDKKGFGHTGGIDGFSSVFMHFTDGDVSYALTSNGANYNTNNISIAVLSAVYNRPFNIPDFKTFNVTSEELDQYLGAYTSTQIPLQLTITKKDATLIAQLTNQPAFPLEAVDKDKFSFEVVGVVLEFNPAQKTVVLKQAGKEVLFTRKPG